MEDAMTVAELIEHLKTLKQDYKVVVGDSEYPDTEMTKDTIREEESCKKYIIY